MQTITSRMLYLYQIITSASRGYGLLSTPQSPLLPTSGVNAPLLEAATPEWQHLVVFDTRTCIPMLSNKGRAERRLGKQGNRYEFEGRP
jgi:hypothetical protein